MKEQPPTRIEKLINPSLPEGITNKNRNATKNLKRSREEVFMLEGGESHEPTRRDARHDRWLAMQSAYAEYRGASEALECTRQSDNESSTNERSLLTTAVDRQRVAFECYFEARMEFLEFRFDESNRPVINEELAERRRKLLMLSEYSVLNAYREAHERCKMEGDALPRARAVQELVTAWRVLWSWSRRR